MLSVFKVPEFFLSRLIPFIFKYVHAPGLANLKLIRAQRFSDKRSAPPSAHPNPPRAHTCRLIANTDTTLESSLLQEEVEEEEVWLYWIDSHKEPHGKSIRHLAQDAKGTHKMDVDMITYYR